MADFQVADLKGESALKPPGSINGESFIIKNLEDCSVYLLDYTSEVEVTNCVNCRIFIGPVDGPAIFEGCSGCQVAVACQQFQAKSCQSCEFGLYCATQPSITSCTGISFSCWVGAYPKLTQHFIAANLEPKRNNWNKVYDGSADEGGAPNFELVEAPNYWEVPIDGEGPCDNPVPAADGSMYQAGNGGLIDDTLEAFPTEAPSAFPAPGVMMDPIDPMENGTNDFMSGFGSSVVEEDNPRVTGMREKQRSRLKEQEEFETQSKLELRGKASEYLEQFYEKRNEVKEARLKENREKDVQVVTEITKGDTAWERVINLIDFQFNRPNGADLARYKNILFTAKTKNIPVKD